MSIFDASLHFMTINVIKLAAINNYGSNFHQKPTRKLKKNEVQLNLNAASVWILELHLK